MARAYTVQRGVVLQQRADSAARLRYLTVVCYLGVSVAVRGLPLASCAVIGWIRGAAWCTVVCADLALH